jgi:hypothetical protein
VPEQLKNELQRGKTISRVNIFFPSRTIMFSLNHYSSFLSL